MKAKEILKICDKCLCNTCSNADCKKLHCSICNLKVFKKFYPIEDCDEYKEQEWKEIRHKIINKKIK